MKITENWLELEVDRYEDGHYLAYEALSDSQKETDNWSAMRQWLRELIDDITTEVEALRDKEESKNE
ncbi:hypothetical protein LCGC14_0396530 [marine sediment metagenome]|uniref:Uncharacterized protein n=1 Tax=marine sediment metagenome TaxID=412755 RepID=A0A0F9VK32_9ZZZZ